jgi:hypothetical protein
MKPATTLRAVCAVGALVPAIAGAADFPSQREKEYLQACPEYDVSYYVIPGTNTCLRLGGFVRLHWDYGSSNAGAVPNFVWARPSSLQTSYTRWVFHADARPMTDFGRARIFIQWRYQVTTDGGGISGGLPWTPPNNVVLPQAAYIQLSGWTFGLRQSVYDYVYTRNVIITPVTGSDRLITMISYQATLAPGWTGTVSAEDPGPRRYPILQVNPIGQLLPGATVPPSSVPDLNYLAGVAGKSIMPELVARLQYSGTWGDVAVMGALHEVRPAYAATAGAGFPVALPPFPGSNAGSGGFVTPDTKLGFAVQGGITLKTPGGGHPKILDDLISEVGFARGALDYTLSCGSDVSNSACFGGITASRGPLGNFPISPHNFLLPTGDAVFNPATGALDLTRSWTAQVRYRHFWTPMWRSVLGFGFTKVDFTGPGQLSPSTASGVFVGSDFSVLQGYAETIWSPYNDLDLGVSVSYTKVDPRGTKDVDSLGATFRAQWNF